MGYSYSLSSSKNDTKPRTCLLWCHMLASVVNIFVTTFLVAHIYNSNGDVYNYIFNVGLYNIATYLSMLIVYLPTSYIVDKTNRVWVYRFSLVMRALLVVFVIFCGEELAKLIVLAGMLHGSSDAVYYASYNVLKEEMVSRKKMSGYSSSTYIIGKIIEIVCPILLGTLIDATTYSSVAIIVLFIASIQILLSFGVKAQRPTDSKFSLKSFFVKTKANPSAKSKIRLLYIISTLFGASALIAMLVNICIMIKYGTSFSLGAITSAISVVPIIVLLLFNKLTKPGKRTPVFVICAILGVAASIMLLINFSKITIIIFNFIIVATGIIYKVVFDIHRNGVLKEEGLYSEISEHQTMIESLLNISRTICFSIVLLVALLQSMLAFHILIIISTILIGGVLIMLAIYEKQFISKPQINAQTTTAIKNNQINN